MIKKVENILRWTYLIEDLNQEEIVGTFYGKLQKLNQIEFRIKEKDDLC